MWTHRRPSGCYRNLQDITAPTDGCISGNCTEYSPGLYPGGLDLKSKTVIFQPGSITFQAAV